MRQADLDRDVAICRAMATDLEAFLLRDIVYWPLSQRGPRRGRYPHLTLGGLVLRLHHLDVLKGSLSPDTYEQYTLMRAAVEADFDSWRVHLERKLLAEVSSRMRPWSFFLAECPEWPSACAHEFPTQVEVRTMIALLLQMASEKKVKGSQKLRTHISGLDRRLQDLTLRAPFVWDPIFEPAYPAEKFWWLYVSPGDKAAFFKKTDKNT